MRWQSACRNVSLLALELALSLTPLSQACGQGQTDFRDERQTLQEILAQDKYQPRSEPESWVTSLWRTYGDSTWSKIKEMFRWIHDKLPDVDQPAWLKAAAAHAIAVFDWAASFVIAVLRAPWTIPLVLIVLACLAIAKYRSQIASFFGLLLHKDPVLVTASGLGNPKDEPLSSLLGPGDESRLLEGMRRALRAQFRITYDVPLAVTDRETLRYVPRSEGKRSVFSDVAEHFERMAYARRPLDRGKLIELYERLVTQERR